MKRPVLLSLFGVCTACAKEPECDTYQENQPDLTCEAIEICCQDEDCWYETDDGQRIDCEANGDCADAAVEVVCTTCDIGEQTSDDLGC